MAEVTIRMVRRVAGYPDPGKVMTIERTSKIDRLLRMNFAVEVTDVVPAEPASTGEGVPTDLTTGGTVVTSETVVLAEDGQTETVVPAEVPKTE